MAITSAISDLFSSFYELIASVLNAAYTIVHSIFLAVYNFVAGIFQLSGNVVEGLANVVGGVGKFIMGMFSLLSVKFDTLLTNTGNIVLLSIGALAAFAFFRYTAQGRQVAAGKKTA